LLDEYASRCTPPLPVKEVDALGNPLKKDQPDPVARLKAEAQTAAGGNNYILPNHRNYSSDKQPGQFWG